MKNSLTKKEKVVIYTIYDEGNLDYSYNKEESLKTYCVSKGYEVVKVFRAAVVLEFADAVNDFFRISHNIYTEREIADLDFTKIVSYDLNEICLDSDEIVTLATITRENSVDFETIKQGKIGSNLTYTINLNDKRK